MTDEGPHWPTPHPHRPLALHQCCACSRRVPRHAQHQHVALQAATLSGAQRCCHSLPPPHCRAWSWCDPSPGPLAAAQCACAPAGPCTAVPSTCVLTAAGIGFECTAEEFVANTTACEVPDDGGQGQSMEGVCTREWCKGCSRLTDSGGGQCMEGVCIRECQQRPSHTRATA